MSVFKIKKLALKGVLENYTWGYHRKPLDYPFHEFQFPLVPLIPYSAIAKKILVRTLIFHIFTYLKNQPLKQRLKQKRRIILKNLQNSSHSISFMNIFYFIKIHN